MHVDVEAAELREPAQRQHVRSARLDRLRVGDHDLLDAVRGDREHARRELVACALLHERGILLAMEEVLVGTACGLLLDDLALLPDAVDLHREAAQRGPLGERDAERALEDPRFGVLEHEMHLGERQRVLDDGVRTQRLEAEAGAVRGGEADGDLGGGERLLVDLGDRDDLDL